MIPMCSHYYESTGNVKVRNKGSKALFEQILAGMLILLGLVGLTNSRRSGTRGTVEDCRRAGIYVKFIVGDNKVTATIMATKCGIIEPDYQPGEVIDGEEFRKFSSEERMAKIENI
ncbi:Hypothetical predicted protein [Olea europaea subsp. europaea]|uniref:Uncharacterized protein n=1 Tax=Olea europaea subsp. europaea TaxID=158383 RepID=A0A8S0S576_OLEEU|nr:Hypothetical predicted protein [Olea europaea subsp. europaea]